MSAGVEQLDRAAIESEWAEPKPDQLLTAEDLAHRWQLSNTSHVYRLAREGVLPVVRLGRYYRFSLTAIEAFENNGGTGG